MVVETTGNEPEPTRSVLNTHSHLQRGLVLGSIILGFSQLFLVDLIFRLQEVPQISHFLSGGGPPNLIEDGIRYPPLVISGLVCGLLVATSVVFVNSNVKQIPNVGLSWLGSAWLFVSLVLVLDLLIDTFEVKWPVIILFAYAGVRYWKGVRRNWLAIILAPAVAAIAALDGLYHFGGQDCVQTGLDSCSAKAVSDVYLVIILLLLTYLTAIRNRGSKTRLAFVHHLNRQLRNWHHRRRLGGGSWSC